MSDMTPEQQEAIARWKRGGGKDKHERQGVLASPKTYLKWHDRNGNFLSTDERLFDISEVR